MYLHRWQYSPLFLPLLTLAIPTPPLLSIFPDPQSSSDNNPTIQNPASDLTSLIPPTPPSSTTNLNPPDCIPWHTGCPYSSDFPIQSKTYRENTWTHKFQVCTTTRDQGEEHCEPAIHMCTKNRETCVVCSVEGMAEDGMERLGVCVGA